MIEQEVAGIADERQARTVWEQPPVSLRRFGLSPVGVVLFALLLVVPWIPPFNQEHLLRWLVMGAFLAAQAVAFDFAAGYINVVNFGFASVVGLGAYTSTILSNRGPMIAVSPGLPPWLTIWCGALVAAVLGFSLGVLTLRLRGIYAAVMSWFVGLALLGLANNLTSLTRGSLGINPRPLLATSSNRAYFYVILAMLALTYLCLKLVTTTRTGLAFRCIGENMEAAAASGIDPTAHRILNFTLSCTFAGLLGGFYAHYIGIVTPQSAMSVDTTVEVLSLVYIGGRGSLWGGAVFAFPFVFLMNFVRSSFPDVPGINLVIYGVLMILVMIFYQDGVAGLYRSVVRKIRQEMG